ncbi:MAG: pyridoxal phosphate-dependent aminotransferase [Rhodospirillaceae bacterium]
MVLKVAKRGQVPPFIVMDVMHAAAEREAEGKEVLHLEVGQPSTGLPDGARQALSEKLFAETLGYTVARGIPELRNRIAQHYRERDGLTVDPEQIFITTGSSTGFLLSFLAAFEAGDRVALAAPGYPAYRHILTALGIEPVLIPVGPDTRYQPSPDHLRALARPGGPGLDGVIVASPSNPTGTVVDAAEMAALCEVCDQLGIRMISDEIYHGLTYGARKTASALAQSENAVIINSFSKYFCMTGWRLGWLVLPKDMLRAVECLAQNFFISAPAISQWAGVLVFDQIQALEANVHRYARNRDVLLEALPKAGFERFAPPDGAFYLYADATALLERAYGRDWASGGADTDSRALCAKILQETGVAITPGLDFDPARGGGFVRFSFCGATETMEQAGDRLMAWSQAL